jgi:hypothetical protein
VGASVDSPVRAYRSFGAQAFHYFDRSHVGLPKGPVRSPASWLGRDLRKREAEWHVQLDDADRAELDRGLARLERRGLTLKDVDRESLPLPRLARRIEAWRREIAEGRGFVVVSGLPVEEWGEARSALAFWGLGHHLGIPGAQNPDHELLGHVKDYGEQTDSPQVRLYRTTSNIRFHCDAADVVGLLCLQTARRGGQSRIASSVAIWNALYESDPDCALAFFEPFALDRRGEHPPDQPGHLDLQPCCFGEDGVLRTFYHSEYFRSAERLPEIGVLPERHLEALDRFDELAISPAFHLDMELQRGDMQFISNHTIVHARTEYEDDPDPARKRHLLRLWLSIDPEALA